MMGEREREGVTQQQGREKGGVLWLVLRHQIVSMRSCCRCCFCCCCLCIVIITVTVTVAPTTAPSTPALPTQPLLPVVGGARKDCRVCPSIIQLAMVVVVRTSEAGKREREGERGKREKGIESARRTGTQAGNVTMSRECCCGFCFIEL